jgi:hypothetical protein
MNEFENYAQQEEISYEQAIMAVFVVGKPSACACVHEPTEDYAQVETWPRHMAAVSILIDETLDSEDSEKSCALIP